MESRERCVPSCGERTPEAGADTPLKRGEGGPNLKAAARGERGKAELLGVLETWVI